MQISNLYPQERSFPTFKEAILHYQASDTSSPPQSFALQSDDHFSEFYIPFDYVNTQAKLVIVGLTPGFHQWHEAVLAAKCQLVAGASDEAALLAAKKTGAFSGPMRDRLIAMMNRVGLQRICGSSDSSAFFDEALNLVHLTSIFTNPLFVNGRNWSGSQPKASIKRNLVLQKSCLEGFQREVKLLPNAFFLPLGSGVQDVMDELIDKGILERDRVLFGMPHPSGANNERIAYFLGQKDPAKHSSRTNPTKIFEERAALEQRISSLFT